MLTVACVWVQGHVPFSRTYVVKLRSMVARHLTRPHTFVCLTDRPGPLIRQGIKAIRVPSPFGMRGWWSKVQLFAPGRFPSGRVLYLDLDTLVVDSLDPIVDFTAPFALVPDGGTFQPSNGLAVVKRFNSSVMVWDAGSQTDLSRTWSKDVTQRLWGDQDWIGEQCPEAAAMPAEWFPRLSTVLDGVMTPDAKVVLAKVPKNVQAAATMPWFAEQWQ